MEITQEFLQENGFDNNHPERVLGKWYKHSKEGNEWNITIESTYIPLSNELAYNVSVWSCNDKGVITKRCQVGYIKTSEELQEILGICNLKLN